MANGSIVKTLIDTAEKLGKLDMSEAERLRRAQEMGFDTERVFYSGSGSSPPEKIYRYGEAMPSGENIFGGVFASESKDIASSHGKNVASYLTAKHIADDDFKSIPYQEDVIGETKKLFRDLKGESISDDEADELFDYMSGKKDIYNDEPSMGRDRFDDIIGKYDDGEISWDLQGLKGEFSRRRGYTSVGMADEHGESVLLLEGARMADAAFDPAKKGSPNLMSSIAGLGTAGLAGASMLSPEQATASELDQYGRNYAQQKIQDSLQHGRGFAYRQSYDVPKNQMYADLAEKAGKYNKWRKENVHPVADFVLPGGEGPEDLLRKAAYGDKIRYMDVLMAELGLL